MIDWKIVDEKLKKYKMTDVKPYLIQFYEKGVLDGQESVEQAWFEESSKRQCSCLTESIISDAFDTEQEES